MNYKHKRRLVKMMYKIHDSSALDEYGSIIFGRPIQGSWRLFRNIAKSAIANVWFWSSELEVASYPKSKKVQTFEEFSTLMLHEVTHGWCYFLKNELSSRKYPNGINEEQVCWHVSRLICDMLGISYHKKSAELCYKYYLLSRAGDARGMARITKKFPMHNRWPTNSS